MGAGQIRAGGEAEGDDQEASGRVCLEFGLKGGAVVVAVPVLAFHFIVVFFEESTPRMSRNTFLTDFNFPLIH